MSADRTSASLETVKSPTAPSTLHSPTMVNGEILPLTSVRFFAAFHVVLYHTWGIFLPSLAVPAYVTWFLSLGYAGVSIFFVLSGYILCVVYMHRNTPPSVDRKQFFLARFARIYPVYAFSLVVSAPFVVMLLGDRSASSKLLKMIFLSVVNFGLLQAWRPVLSGGWNVPAWSISAEAFFYLLFPILAVWIWTKIQRPLLMAFFLWCLTVTISLITIHMPFLQSAVDRHGNEFLLFNPLLRLPEFLIGVAVATWQQRTKFVAPWWLAIGSILATLALVPLLVKSSRVLVSNGLLAPLFALMLVGLGSSSGFFERLLSFRPFVFLGRASFSLYLLHLPVLFWFCLLGRGGNAPAFSEKQLFRPTSIGPGPLIAYLAISLAISIASYEWIESSGRRFLLNRVGQKKPITKLAR